MIVIHHLESSGPEVTKLFFMLSSAETEFYSAHEC